MLKHDRKGFTLKKNQRGYTLIELLVVVAIMSITVGMASLGLSLLYSRDAEKCAKTINSMMESSRMYAMSKTGDFTMTVDFENNMASIPDANEQEDLQSRVRIYLPDKADAKKVDITFDKSTGRVSEILVDGGSCSDTVLRITAENSTNKKASVVLVVNTGKHFVDYR